MQSLRITTVQQDLAWEDPERNLANFEQEIAALKGKTDLVILPEMFTTGFSMNAAVLAEEGEGPTLQWLRTQASKLDAVVTGSYIAKDQDSFFNRLIWMEPSGQYQIYDKRHLFSLAGEDKTYTPGQKRLIAEWKGWKICPLICYDLRFPVWSRNTENYDLLIYMANWPETRRHHWTQLLIARAIENQAYVSGVNRVGSDAKGLSYTGDSTVIDYAGNTIYRCSGENAVFTSTLQRDPLLKYRNTLQFLPDQDLFEIFPGK